MPVTRAVGNRRLLKLAAFLRNLPRKRFDYTSWVGADWKGAPDLSCGTTACALGWATTIPAFRKLGLRMHRGIDTVYGIDMPVFRGHYADSAAAQFFGLNLREAGDLFFPRIGEEEATPKYVAATIRKVLFQYSVSDLLAGARERLAYHTGRAEWWDAEYRAAAEKAKAAGVEVREYDVTGGKNAQLVLDASLQNRINECAQKRTRHQGMVKEYAQWVAVLASQSGSAVKDIQLDDALYFGVAKQEPES